MDQNGSLTAPAQTRTDEQPGIKHKPWLKLLLGFLGWFLLTLPAVRFPNFLYGAYLPANFTLLAVLLLLKRTRLVGLGMAAPETNVLR